MKQNYQLVLIPREQSKPIQKMKMKGTLWQANKAFQALRVALHVSEFSELRLNLLVKDGSECRLNAVQLTGVDDGL